MMNYSEFILLYNGSERESVRNAIRNGAGFALSSGVPFLYYGNLPSSSPILLASFSLGSYENSREIYISSLEAVSLGHEIVAYGEYRALLAAIKGAEDGNGRIHCVFSEGLESLRFRKAGVIRRILLTGGSVISSSCLFSSRTEARFLITSLSSSALAVVGGSKLSASHPLIEMLDSGKDIFLLRSSL